MGYVQENNGGREGGEEGIHGVGLDSSLRP